VLNRYHTVGPARALLVELLERQAGGQKFDREVWKVVRWADQERKRDVRSPPKLVP
jgi:hypothetical protein